MSDAKPKAAFFHMDRDGGPLFKVWTEDRVRRLHEHCDMIPGVVVPEDLESRRDELAEVEYGFSTWGMPELTDAHLDCLPGLTDVFYAAGSVQTFARPLLRRNIRVHSAWVANAIPVSEFALAQILLACKGYFRNSRERRRGGTMADARAYAGPGIYGNRVALIGYGMIARKLRALLRPFSLEVLVVDPYLDEEEIASEEIERVSLEQAFERAYVVSNHLPNIPETQEMIRGDHFNRLQPGATFINTGRGQQVNEPEMIEVLREREDITALLDVTWPEPPESGSPLYDLPNVHLSGHIAGSIHHEVVRMADYMLDELELRLTGRPGQYEVSLEMLKTMA